MIWNVQMVILQILLLEQHIQSTYHTRAFLGIPQFLTGNPSTQTGPFFQPDHYAGWFTGEKQINLKLGGKHFHPEPWGNDPIWLLWYFWDGLVKNQLVKVTASSWSENSGDLLGRGDGVIGAGNTQTGQTDQDWQSFFFFRWKKKALKS